MSRGPGKIERAIEVLFQRHPDDAFTVEDIVDRIYEGTNGAEKRHRVSVLRAAKKVCERMTDWTFWLSETRGNTLTFRHRYNVRSYAMARLKVDNIERYRNKDPRCYRSSSAEELRAMLEPGGSKHRLIVEGGAWWQHVQQDIAERDGDTERALRLQAEQDEALLRVAQGIRSALSH
jgi:hypothetical protein